MSCNDLNEKRECGGSITKIQIISESLICEETAAFLNLLTALSAHQKKKVERKI